jgi:hypothetical protein
MTLIDFNDFSELSELEKLIELVQIVNKEIEIRSLSTNPELGVSYSIQGEESEIELESITDT